MRIALLQYPIEWANPQANIGLLDERLHAIAGQADLAVVPEMFTTGFCTDRPGLAEEWGTGETCRALQQMADEYNLAIVGSMMATDKGEDERLISLITDHVAQRGKPQMSVEEQLALLATDGMLVKRPLLIADDRVLVGLREAEYESLL